MDAGRRSRRNTRADKAFEFPVGTDPVQDLLLPARRGAADAVLKTYDAEPGAPAAGLDLSRVRLVETRLLVRRADGWTVLPYVWNADQSEARLERTGDEKALDLVDAQGHGQKFTYVVPNENQCASCHVTNLKSGEFTPLGPKARNLNRTLAYADGTENQIARWARAGFLTGVPAGELPRAADWRDAQAPIADRARTYLDVNCAHCHQAGGTASNTSLRLDALGPADWSLGLCKPSVAAGKGTGDRIHDIVPGKPDDSILPFRLASTEGGVMMPELGRSTVHQEGVQLIRDWIAAMPGHCQTRRRSKEGLTCNDFPPAVRPPSPSPSPRSRACVREHRRARAGGRARRRGVRAGATTRRWSPSPRRAASRKSRRCRSRSSCSGREDIAKVGAVNLAQVADFVPGLTIDASQPTQPSYALRGLGNGDFGIGTDAPVGVYVNGIYTGKTGGALLNFNDVKRVEVLKGPQGTLFGRNSAGGAISIVTNDPDGTRLVSGLVRVGNYGTLHAEGVLNQPLGRGPEPAHLGGRREERRLGHQHRRRQEEPAVAHLGHAPRRALVALGRHQRRADVGARGPQRAPAPDLGRWPPRTAPAASRPGSIRATRRCANDVIGGKESRLFNGVNLRIEHELSDRSCSRRPPAGATSTRSTSRTTTAPPTRPPTWPPATSRRARRSSRSSASTARAGWPTGSSARASPPSTPTQTSRVDTNTTTLDPVLFQILNGAGRGPAGAAVLAADRHRPDGRHPRLQPAGPGLEGRHPEHARRAFRGVDGRRHLARGRHDQRDHRRALHAGHQEVQLVQPAALGAGPGRAAGGAVAGLLPASSSTPARSTSRPPTALAGLAQGLQQTNIEFANPEWAAAPVYTSKTWHNTSPRLVVDHQLTPDTMVYGSVTRGYQAGGFNSVSTQANGGRFDPETITSYELGAKGRVAGRRHQLQRGAVPLRVQEPAVDHAGPDADGAGLRDHRQRRRGHRP